MIQITDAAQAYFRRLIEQQEAGFLGIRLSAMRAGTPSADARLEFCEQADLDGSEWALECEGFTLYVEGASAPFFDGAEIDFKEALGGGQVNIKAPRIKGGDGAGEGSVVARVQRVLDTEINPQLAAHGGRVSIEQITAENAVVLRFGGGCHGCGMVDVTLRQGVEVTLRERVPEVTAVIDATDHDSGSNPYYKRQA
jgi:Fe/S biogenesis protein NfuA